MRALYLGIYNLFIKCYFLLFHEKSTLSYVYIYFFYNILCIFLVLYSVNQGHLKNETILYTIALSALLFLFDRWKLGVFLSKLFTVWTIGIGLTIKDKAYANIHLTNEKMPNNESIEILNDDILFHQTILIENPSHPNKPIIEEDIRILKDYADDISKTKEDGFVVGATFFSSRQPFTFMLDQEIAVIPATSIIALLNFILISIWQKGYLGDPHLAFQLMLYLSILFVSLYFAVISIIKREFSLEYESTYFDEYPNLKDMFSKYKGKKMQFDRVEVYKNFFSNYFKFYQYKVLLSFVSASIYFVLISLIYTLAEHILFNNSIAGEVFSFWIKFYISLTTIWVASFIWFASFLMTSLWKTMLVNLFFTLILFGIFTYIFTESFELLIEKTKQILASMSVFWLLLSYFVLATKKIFLEKENNIVWDLS